jgi:hypothetical protein
MSKQISKKQLEANRKNASLGGVKTSQGKAISKLNAMKHGLLSKEILLDGEDETSLIELGKRIRSYLQPIGEIELVLTERIITSIWRLKRVLRAEKSTMGWYKEKETTRNRYLENTSDEQIIRESEKEMLVNRDIEKIIRYETSIDRGLYKALHELQRIQLARSSGNPIAPLAVDLDISK